MNTEIVLPKISLLAQLMYSFPEVLAPPPKWSPGGSKAIAVNPALTRAAFIPAPLKADTEHCWGHPQIWKHFSDWHLSWG